MTKFLQYEDIGSFLSDVRTSIITEDPTQQNYFDIYANEARFGFSLIEDDINALSQEAEVLEIGAGMLLLSGYLAFRGVRIHALEPIGTGFLHFREFHSAVMRYYENKRLHLHLIDSTIETFSEPNCFDYVFSINVFEHISNVELGLTNAYLSLSDGGSLRIYCPNYHFPYEPHFNIPTLVSKRLTEYIFKSMIFESKHVVAAKETWDMLNWITVTQVRMLFRHRFGNEPIFNPLTTYQIIRRVLVDSEFRARRPNWILLFLRVIDRLGLMHLFKYFPVMFTPIMDFRIQRIPDKYNRT